MNPPDGGKHGSARTGMVRPSPSPAGTRKSGSCVPYARFPSEQQRDGFVGTGPANRSEHGYRTPVPASNRRLSLSCPLVRRPFRPSRWAVGPGRGCPPAGLSFGVVDLIAAPGWRGAFPGLRRSHPLMPYPLPHSPDIVGWPPAVSCIAPGIARREINRYWSNSGLQRTIYLPGRESHPVPVRGREGACSRVRPGEEIQTDETHIGGKRKNEHRSKRHPRRLRAFGLPEYGKAPFFWWERHPNGPGRL